MGNPPHLILYVPDAAPVALLRRLVNICGGTVLDTQRGTVITGAGDSVRSYLWNLDWGDVTGVLIVESDGEVVAVHHEPAFPPPQEGREVTDLAQVAPGRSYRHPDGVVRYAETWSQRWAWTKDDESAPGGARRATAERDDAMPGPWVETSSWLAQR